MPLRSEEEGSLVQLHPSYKRGEKPKHAERKLQEAQKRMAAKESEWQRKLLPKDSEYALCDEVHKTWKASTTLRSDIHGLRTITVWKRSGMYMYTHQCMFCQACFLHIIRIVT